MNLLNYRMRITLSDSRVLTGQMLAFDKHMNLVLADCEEFRKMKAKAGATSSQDREQKRTLGLVILRGETIVSLSVDGPPPPSAEDQRARISQVRGDPTVECYAVGGISARFKRHYIDFDPRYLLPPRLLNHSFRLDQEWQLQLDVECLLFQERHPD